MGEEAQKLWKSIVEMEADQHMVSEQGFIILATNDLDVTRKDASRIYSSVDWNLPTGPRAHTYMTIYGYIVWSDMGIYMWGLPTDLRAHTATYCYCAPRAHQLVDFIEHAAVITNGGRSGL